MPLIICPKCKAKISDRAGKCVKCGYELGNLVKCPICGALHDKDVLDCPECRYNKIKEEERKAIEKKPQEEQVKEKSEVIVKTKKQVNKKVIISLSVIFIILVSLFAVYLFIDIKELTKAKSLFGKGEYDQVIEICQKVYESTDDKNKKVKATALIGDSYFKKEDYETAKEYYEIFVSKHAKEVKECNYYIAINKYEEGDYLSALDFFENNLEYGDSKEYITKCYDKKFIEYASNEYTLSAWNILPKTSYSSKEKEEFKKILEPYLGTIYHANFKDISEILEYYEALSEYEYFDLDEQVANCNRIIKKEKNYQYISPSQDYSDGLIYEVYGFQDNDAYYIKIVYNAADAKFSSIALTDGYSYFFEDSDFKYAKDGIAYFKREKNETTEKTVKGLLRICVIRKDDRMGVGHDYFIELANIPVKE